MATSFMESGYWAVAGWTMLHFLWVGGVIGLIAGAGRLVLAPARPNIRYAFALACLAALTAAPLAIALIVTAEGTPHMTGSGFDTAPWPQDPSVDDGGLVANNLPSRRHGAVEVEPALTRAMAALCTAADYLPWVWLIGTPLVFMLAATGLAGAERLGRQSRLLSHGEAPLLCRRLLGSLKMARHVAVGVCDRITSPVLIGILRPVILLPPAALMGWTTDQLEMVLLHELAHVRRWDNLVNFLQRIVEAFLFFHPVVWLVSRWVRCEREHCCDEAVLAYTRRPRAYAEMLATMVSPAAANLALVAMAEANVVTRIRRVLRLENEGMRLSRKLVSVLTCLFLATAILIGTSVRHSVAAQKTDIAALPSLSEQALRLTLGNAGVIADPVFAARTEANSTPPQPSTMQNGQATNKANKTPVQLAPQDTVTLRVVDAAGGPVEGANFALQIQWKNGNPEFHTRQCDPDDRRTGKDGRIQLPWIWFSQGSAAGTPIMVMHQGRGESGIGLVARTDRGRELTMTVHRSCRVRFQLDSTGLTGMGWPMIQAKGHILLRQSADLPVFAQTINRPLADARPYDFEYLLPPGEYSTWAFGDADGRPETEHVRVPFEVKEGQKELDLGFIDLPPTRYSMFYGQPAPEFIQVKNLRDNSALSLADMKGKTTLVHFTLGSDSCLLGELRTLHGTYAASGLQVVVIHSPDAAAAVSRGASTTASFIETVDSGGQTPVEGTSRSVMGATAAAYGVETSGLLLLVDREGRLVQRLRVERSITRGIIERELGLRQ